MGGVGMDDHGGPVAPGAAWLRPPCLLRKAGFGITQASVDSLPHWWSDLGLLLSCSVW